MPPSTGTLWGTEDVARFAGASLRQIDYWTRVGVLVPARPARGSGSVRGYDAVGMRVAWLIARMQEGRGVPRDGLEALAEFTLDLRHRPVPWLGLVVIGTGRVAYIEHAVELLDALDRLGPAVTVVDLERCPDPVTWSADP